MADPVTYTAKLVPHEILIRYDNSGVLQGAHVVMLGMLLGSDGSVVAQQQQPAQAIDTNSDPTFAATLGQALTDALVQVNALAAKVSQLQSQLEQPGTSPS